MISFKKPEHAEKCLNAHEISIEGSRLYLERYISKEDRHEEYFKLFLNKIPGKSEDRAKIEATLTEEFSKFGKLARKIEIEFKEAQSKLGHAIIYFTTQNSA